MEKHTAIKQFGVSNTPIILASRTLQFEEQRNFFGGLRQIDLNFSRIWVKFTSIPDCLKCDSNQLILLDFVGYPSIQASSEIKNLRITNYSTPYNIVYNPQAIHDCSDLSTKDIEVKYQICFQETSTSKVSTYDFLLKINLIKANAESNVRFCFNSDSASIMYENSVKLLGYLKIENPSPYEYANLLSIKNILRYNQAFEHDIVFWGDETEVQESNACFNANAGIRTLDQELKSTLEVIKSDDELTLNNIVSNNIISIPIYIDLSRIGNPYEDFITSSFSIEIMNLLNAQKDIYTYEFSISRDTQCTQLAVLVDNCNVDNEVVLNVGKFKWIKHLPGQSRRFEGSSNLLELKIKNIAENVSESLNAAVVVRNMRITIEDTKHCLDEAVLYTSSINDTVELYNAPFSEITIPFKLSHKKVSTIIDDLTEAQIHIQFDYLEDREGIRNEESIYKSFHCTLKFVVETDPGNEWLCVDFGTSATVAAFGDGSKPSSLLDLDHRAEIVGAYAPKQMRTPRFEQGTPFLSSNAKFRQGGIIGDNLKYQDNFIWLSPTSRQFYSDSYVLPYIKSLVGYHTLPSNLDFTGLRYQKDGKNYEFSAEIFTIDDIFNALYKSLFNDFIIPTIDEDNQNVNKLILSIPNTYTPRHIDYLYKLVTTCMPQLRKNYVWFISESDAIASYYITNWYDLNSNRESIEMNRLSDAENTEHVLVYDMGAGTLDLTYFKIFNNNDGTRVVTILAKMGLNKAGNYLDYLIARALIETHSAFLPISLLTPNNDPMLIVLAGKLKQFIKQEVKPRLFTEDNIIFSELNGEQVSINDKLITLNDIQIDLIKIREHELIHHFINECSRNLIENLFVINGYRKGQTPLDTVMFTGRGVQFGDESPMGIRASVMRTLEEWNSCNQCFQIDVRGNDLKTVVCNGALHFATTYSSESSAVKFLNRNIYASYGVLYKDIRGRYMYHELLSPRTKFTREPNLEINSHNGLYVYEYDTDKYCAQAGKQMRNTINLRNSPNLYFVQSYSLDTAEDWKNNKHELISVMWEVSSDSVVSSPRDKESVHVRIEVNADNEMIFTAGSLTNEPSSSLIININESESFKKGMWPYM